MIKSSFHRFCLVSILGYFFLLSGAGHAQEDSDKKTTSDTITQNNQPKNQKQPVPSADKPQADIHAASEVVGVYSGRKKVDTEKREIASIGDLIIVRISNGDAFKKRALCKDDSSGRDLPAGICKKQDVKLFINGRIITGIEPEDGAPQLDKETGDGLFQFRLDRNTDNNNIWADILGAPPMFKKEAFLIPVRISIGLSDEYALNAKEEDADKFYIERIHKGWFWACFAGIFLLFGTLIFLAKKHGLLRDRAADLNFTEIMNPDRENKKFAAPPNKPPYSLGRFQMAFWFTLIVTSYLFIWLITDAYDILSASVLALIGISAGTSLSAVVIDESKSTALITETKDLQTRYNDPATTAIEKAQILDKMKGNIKQLQSRETKGFFNDILRDANGVSFHRLQMLVWTFVLGLIFVYTVWKSLSMPDFDPILLALQGLTAGTYLGFKFPEKHN